MDATRAALGILVILSIAALVGAQLLHLFGVSLDGFKVAGGGVLAWMGFSMLSRQLIAPASSKENSGSTPSLTPLIMFAACPGHKPVKNSRGVKVPSIDRESLESLKIDATSQRAIASVRLIQDFKLAVSLASRLASLEDHIQEDGRIHSCFDDIQASGRISSRKPNLQQIAKLVAVGGDKEIVSGPFKNVSVRSRNTIVASEGHTLVAFDVAQEAVFLYVFTFQNVLPKLSHSGQPCFCLRRVSTKMKRE